MPKQTNPKPTANPRTRPATKQETFTGIIESIRFHNASNAYSVLSVSTPQTEEACSGPMVCVGAMALPRQGDSYTFWGEWKEDAKWGRQFKFAKAELILPATADGAARYLSDITAGVGPKKAAKIVKVLGDNALEQIRDNPGCLNGLPFLDDRQRGEIAADLQANTVKAELAGIICRPGIGLGTVEQVFARYGADSVATVKANPYILAETVAGIGFKKADEIGLATGIDPASPFRVRAAFGHTLSEGTSDGHSFLTPSKIWEGLIGHAGIIKGSGIGVPEMAAASEYLLAKGDTIREGNCIYLKDIYKAECNTAAYVRKIMSNSKMILFTDWNTTIQFENLINDMENKYGIAFAPEQRQAIYQSANENLSIICGGPGTGKSTVLLAICDMFEQLTKHRKPIYICAPTGRAAKRMSEATGREASTIHRLLGYNPEMGFTVNALDPLPGGLLVADEASMADIELASALFEAAHRCQVILVGDTDQLPSVGPGSVLRDLIASGVVPTVRLSYNFRQAGGSRIASMAAAICSGMVPMEIKEATPGAVVQSGDVEYHCVEDAEEAARIVVQEALRAQRELGDMSKWQVLCPMYNGSCGIDAINSILQESLNPASPEKPSYGKFRLGAKCQVTKNNYRLDCFNGDNGIISNVGSTGVYVDFGDKEVFFQDDDMRSLVLGYAVSIHRFQGSEAPTIIMPILRQHYMMLRRSILYTGITRAKNRLVLVGDTYAVKKAVDNDRVEERFSRLAERVKGEGNP